MYTFNSTLRLVYIVRLFQKNKQKKTYYFYSVLCVWLHAYLCTMCVQHPWRLEEALDALELVTDGWLWAGCWFSGSNPGTPEELPTAEPPLQPQVVIFSQQ